MPCGNQLVLPSYLSAVALVGSQLPGVFVTNLSGQIELVDILHSVWCCDSSPCLGMNQSGTRPDKAPSLKIQIRQVCTPLSSQVRVSPQFGSAEEQIADWDYDMGTAGMTQSAKTHVLVVVGPSPLLHHSLYSQWLNSTDYSAVRMVRDQNRGSGKLNPMLWGSWLGSLFPQGRPVCVVFCYPRGGAMWQHGATSFTLLRQFALIWGTRACSLLCFRILSVVSYS